MKKLLFVGLTTLMMGASVSAETFVLDSPLIDLLDGKSYAIDGDVYHLMIKMRRIVRQLLYGTQNELGQLIGSCEFDGQMYSIVELVIIEQQNEREFISRTEELNATKHQYSQDAWDLAVQEAHDRYENKKARLRAALEKVKEEFLIMTAPYMGFMRFKDPILGLIQESCKHRDNKNCFLLKWGEEQAGQEGTLMRREIITFKVFEKFCIDLTDYLGDMAESCPKAKKMFIEILKKKKNRA